MALLAPVDNRAEKEHRFDHLSFSALSLFQQCPLRFHFRYLARLPEESVAASLVFGGAVHRSIEHHYEQLLVGQPAPSLDVMLDVFQDAWRQHDGVEVRFNKGEDINSIGRLADRMLRAFQQSAIAHPDGKILGIEEELRGELLPGVPDLLARVDLIVETDDALAVTDFKTARSTWSADHVSDLSSQLLLYHELVRPLADGKPIRLAFTVLTKASCPEVTLHPVVADHASLERTKQIAERIWRAIEASHFYPSPSPLNCSSCPYRQPCRQWTG